MIDSYSVKITRSDIKSNAKALLSDHKLLLTLIFGGFIYISLLIILELFSEYFLLALLYNTAPVSPIKYEAIFKLICLIPSFLLSSPFMMGLKRLAAKLSNGVSASFSEIFIYYSSWKKLLRAWEAAAVVILPIAFAVSVSEALPFVLTGNLLITALNIVLFLICFTLCGLFFPFINSVICGGEQPISLCLKASLKAAKGRAWSLVAFRLSFIPLLLLSVLTAGTLFIIFTFPYILVSECIYSKYLLTGEYRDHTTEEIL